MSSKQQPKPVPKNLDRRAEALRENLLKRKEQLRLREAEVNKGKD